MAITSVVNTDQITVLGPPSSIDLQVDLGATGERGSIIYAAAGEPAGSGSVAFINVPPKVGDVFISWNHGGAYGDRFTVVDDYPEDPGRLMLRWDKWEHFTPIEEVDFSNMERLD